MPEDQEQPVKTSRSIGRRIYRFVRNILAVIGLLFVLHSLFFNLTVVVSGSMAPTLRGEGGPGSDWVLSERVSYWFRKPKRWEVVRFRDQQGFLIAKRVVGLPGETISLKNFEIFIDGNKIDVPEDLSFLKYYSFGNLVQQQEYDCGEEYYVLGDDSKDSADSRFDGTISKERILGRAWLIVWPLDRFAFVNP